MFQFEGTFLKRIAQLRSLLDDEPNLPGFYGLSVLRPRSPKDQKKYKVMLAMKKVDKFTPEPDWGVVSDSVRWLVLHGVVVRGLCIQQDSTEEGGNSDSAGDKRGTTSSQESTKRVNIFIAHGQVWSQICLRYVNKIPHYVSLKSGGTHPIPRKVPVRSPRTQAGRNHVSRSSA